jgi:hypothetical protein
MNEYVALWTDNDSKESEVPGEKTVRDATSFTTKPTKASLGLNLGRH